MAEYLQCYSMLRVLRYGFERLNYGVLVWTETKPSVLVGGHTGAKESMPFSN